MKIKLTKCLYCETVFNYSPHFESACCNRGMCEGCFQSGVGTMEQLQIDHIDEEENYQKYVVEAGYKDSPCDYICFDCPNK